MFKLLSKYQTESKKDKKLRLKNEAKAFAEEMKKDAKVTQETIAERKKKNPPLYVKYGLNHVTTLIENNKAKLVAIAHNVEPIELVLHLPALCRKKNIPFCFIKGKHIRLLL